MIALSDFIQVLILIVYVIKLLYLIMKDISNKKEK